MHVIIDARRHWMVRPVTGNMMGYTELFISYAARAYVEMGHRVDVLCAEPEEEWQDGVYWWPAVKGPRKCDFLLLSDQAEALSEIQAGASACCLTHSYPPFGENRDKVAKWLLLSDYHAAQFLRRNPEISAERCRVVPPALDWKAYEHIPYKVKGRLIWCNSPDRGLIHLMRIWPQLVERVPDISLSVTYDFDTYFDHHAWAHEKHGVDAWELRRWMETTPNVVKHGPLSREEIVREQLQAEVFAYPSDPPEVGQMVHFISALECLAAGAIVIMPALESFPSLYGDCATILSMPMRDEEWVEAIAAALTKPSEFDKQIKAGRKLAKEHGMGKLKWHLEKVLEEAACLTAA